MMQLTTQKLKNKKKITDSAVVILPVSVNWQTGYRKFSVNRLTSLSHCLSIWRRFSTSPAVCWCSSSSNLYPETLLQTAEHCNLYIPTDFWSKCRLLYWTAPKLARLLDAASKFALFLLSGLKDEKLIKKQTYMKTETCKLYSRVSWTLKPNVIKIDPYNFEL